MNSGWQSLPQTKPYQNCKPKLQNHSTAFTQTRSVLENSNTHTHTCVAHTQEGHE